MLPNLSSSFTLYQSMKTSFHSLIASLTGWVWYHFPFPQIFCSWKQVFCSPPHKNLQLLREIKLPYGIPLTWLRIRAAWDTLKFFF
ncbi:hypothetical protein CISIN_1g043712mg [Citrus sinensis]|uniref:Uncharacterized protein n=1 Tax=Citrus sinensis TaxID=2711 RepID=A0A067D9T6_CITSI|nr:hypothetical protein CISIN_1g043712mg [Citrus sinensis]